MASVSESCSNAVHGTSSASQDKVGQFPMFFQGLEIILKDPDKSYQDKVCALLSAWERLASYTNQSSIGEGISKITDCLYRDTLRLVLRCEWESLPQINKTHLTVTLQRTAASLSNTRASELCQHVIRLIKNPWKAPTLSRVISDSEISDDEVLDFCVAENPVLLSARLDIMCESKCEDIALRLVELCRKCSSASDTRFSAMCSSSHLEYWLDLHVALLYRAKKIKDELVPLVGQLTFDEGYQLVKRLIDRGKAFDDATATVSRSRVWRPSLKVADTVSHCLITKALILCPPPPYLKALVVQLVNLQKLLGKLSQDVMNMLRDLVDRVSRITSAHMYMLGSALSAEFGEEFKPLCIELYVRALAVDINYHEKLISKRDEMNRTNSSLDEASIQNRDALELEFKRAETGLAEAISSLADLVRANVRVCKECALTAFSLEPTTARFDKLVELAAFMTEQSKGDSMLTSPAADLSAMPTPVTDRHQSTMEQSRNAVVGEPPPDSGGGPGGGSSSPSGSRERRGSDCSTLEFSSVKEALDDADSGVDLPDVPNGSCDLGSPATQTSDEETTPYSDAAAASLGVSASVVKDLAVVVHGVRWEVLNWKMGWKKLEPLCRQYLANPEMRSVTEELRFLKPDFTQFKDIPRPERDEFWGIEKGYENCIETFEEVAVESPRPKPRSQSNRKSTKRNGRPASGSSSPQPAELAERKKVLKKKLARRESNLSLKHSSDSDSPRPLDPNEIDLAANTKRLQRSKTKKTSPLIKTLRAMRPDLSNGTQWTDCTVPANRLSLEGADQSVVASASSDSCSNNVQQQLSRSTSASPPLSSSSSPSLAADDHFAPMLSTLDINPKVVLTRTPVNSPGPSPVKQILVKGTKPLQTSPDVLRSYVLLEKLDQKHHINLERTMTNLKGIDNITVNPQTTAVHMVQLPNLPANAHVATANGLSVSAAGTGTATTITNNGNANPEIRREEQQQQEEGNKTTSSSTAASAPNGEDPPVFSSTTSVEITSAPSGTSLPEVTLLSTPSVSIFQVAHRPAGNAGAVLQPVAAVRGFNPPNPRLKNPVVGTAARLAKGRGSAAAVTAVPVRPAVELELPPTSPNLTLAQLLAQSPSTEETVPASPTPNGPASSAGTHAPAGKATGTRGGKRRGAASNSSDVAPSPQDGNQVGSSASVSSSSPLPADNSSPCHVPLVKYVDLNMVSSPSRPRPGSTAGMRRLSQGSNSNSPDPHRTKNHRGAQNPASPAINSPQSPALQAPPSPLSFRKQQQQQSHHIFRGQDNKGDRLASPNHPSQCSSPFSRPSSRSQDTSPSPSDLLSGSMFPPNFMPFSSSEGGSNSNHPGASPNPGSSAPSTGRVPSFGASLPSQANAANFPSALPKFGQAFSRKSHFEVIPSLGSLGSPPTNVMTPSAALPAINAIPEPHLQVGRISNNATMEGNGFGGEATRRFPVEQHTPTEEVEGLGSKLSSLLESALNGQITRSPTRSVPSSQPIVSNPDLLLSDSAHSISPLVGGMDSQSGSEVTGGGTTAFTEQLREFESIFAQVRGHWPDQQDDGFMGVGAEFMAPPSTFSESMDVSEASLASPNSAEGPSSSQAEEAASNVTNESPSGAQLHDLLSAASTARQALKNEERENESSTQSPLAAAKITSIKEEVVEEITTESRSEPETQSVSSDHAFPSPPPVAPPTPKSNPARVVMLPAVVAGPIVVQTAEAAQPSVASTVNNLMQSTNVVTAVKSEPPSKNSKTKTNAKPTPIVSPGASASNSPSKVTTPTSSSSSSASSKAPQKAHDDEHTVLRVQAILEEYKEQLRNSPDLQNKPAPRRRSNPLPSPSTSAPKRRKSVQSKVKLLSQHVRPPDGPADGASNATGSAESTPSASNEPQTSNSENASPIAESSKAESNNQASTPSNPAVSDKPEGTVAVQMIPAGIQLSIPAGAVVTNRPAASANDGTSASSAPAGTATVSVSAPQGTQLTSLTGVPTVPLSTVLSQHQLLVSTGTAGVQRLQLVPLNFSQARAGQRSTYIQVRQVTMSGQPGVISFPARFTAPIRYVSTANAAQPSSQPGGQDQQQILLTSLPKVATSTAGETHLLLQEIPSTQATGTVLKPNVVSAAPSQPATVVSLNAGGTPVKSEDAEPSSETTAKTEASASTTSATATTSVLRLLPTVTKVNLPVPPSSIETPLLSPTALPAPVEPSTPTPPPLTLASVAIDTPLDTSSVAETEATSWSHHSSPNELPPAASVDNAVTPVADEKLLSDVETGVSEFLPCADFMGPCVSPSPCFSLSDSPLGSQDSSPVTSPATFHASSTEEDSNSHAITGDDAMLSSAGSSKSNRSKILKRNNKPRMVMVRKDHGGMEYRRMGDGEGGPGIIRNETQTLSKRLAAKKAAAAAAAGAATSANSSPAHPASRPASPLTSTPAPSSPAPPSTPADATPTKAEAKPKSITLMIKKTADKHIAVQKTVDKAKQVEMVVIELPAKANDSTDQGAELTIPKEEPMEADAGTTTETPVEADGGLATRPRRCSRLKKEPVEEPAEHDSQACHLGGETKMLRRSSVRTNVKKNCPCCVSGTNEKRKRAKSEPAPLDSGSSDPPTPAKRGAGSAASQSFTEGTASATTPLTTRLSAANAAAKNDSTPTSRSKPAKKSQRKR